MQWIQLTKQPIEDAEKIKALKNFIAQLPFATNELNAADREHEIESVRDSLLRTINKNYKPQNHHWLRTMANVLADLCNQRWLLKVQNNHLLGSRPKDMGTRQELRDRLVSRRNQQLREKSVQLFISNMEKWRLFKGHRVSILSLMCDGRELINRLENQEQQSIQPYIQFITPNQTCEFTGLKLQDIWRYFRHTWANPYESVPGRSILMIVRDASGPFHPVIGISALSSAAVSLTARDKYIGWDATQIISGFRQNPTNEAADWVLCILKKSLSGIYLVDLIRDEVISSNPTENINESTITLLRTLANTQKESHHRLMDSQEYKTAKTAPFNSDEDWEIQAKTPLFLSKRSGELANILEIWKFVDQAYAGYKGEARLANLVSSEAGRSVVSKVIRIARSMSVGTEIADLTICGAIAPYNHLAAGKLIAMLSASPASVCGYRDRYENTSSVIASSMAGKKISRSANLVYVGTTSLYGKRPNQYDRISYPAIKNQFTNEMLRYQFIPDYQSNDGLSKTTKGVGTFQFGSATLKAMEEFTVSINGGWKVNNVFGEGASPKLRALRQGLDSLNLNSDELLIHGIGKCIYGANLAKNTANYLLGIEDKPKYIFSLENPEAFTKHISEWWYNRWAKVRLNREDIIQKISQENLIYPIRHNAKVKLPENDQTQLGLF